MIEPAASPPSAAMTAAAAAAAVGVSGGSAVGGNVPNATAAVVPADAGPHADVTLCRQSHGRRELTGSGSQQLPSPSSQHQPQQQPRDEQNNRRDEEQRVNSYAAEQCRRRQLQQEPPQHLQSHLKQHSPQKQQQERQCSIPFNTPRVDAALQATTTAGVATIAEAMTSVGDDHDDVVVSAGARHHPLRQPPSLIEQQQQPLKHQYQEEWQGQQSQGLELDEAAGGATANTKPHPDASRAGIMPSDDVDGGTILAAAVPGKPGPLIRDIGAGRSGINNAFKSWPPSRPVVSLDVSSGPRPDLDLNPSAAETIISGGNGGSGHRNEQYRWQWHLSTARGAPTCTAEGLQKRKVGADGSGGEAPRAAVAAAKLKAAGTVATASGTAAATQASENIPRDEDGGCGGHGGDGSAVAKNNGDLHEEQQPAAVGGPSMASVRAFHQLQARKQQRQQPGENPSAAAVPGGSDRAAEGYNTDDDSDEEVDEFNAKERRRSRTTPPSTAPGFEDDPQGYGGEDGPGITGSPSSPAGRHMPSPASRSSPLDLVAGEAVRLAAWDGVEVAANKGVAGAGVGMGLPAGAAGRGCRDAADAGDSPLVATVAAATGGTSHVPVAIGNETRQHHQPASELRPVQQEQQLLLQQNALAEEPSSPGVEDVTVQERRGRHKGLICSVRNCNKFARLTNTGLRRYCIQHMRQLGYTPKSYESRNQSQMRYQQPQHAPGDGGCSGGGKASGGSAGSLPSGSTVPMANAYQGPRSGGSAGSGGGGAAANATGCGELLSHALSGGGRYGPVGGDDSFTSQHGQLQAGAPNVGGAPFLDEYASTYRLQGSSQLPYSDDADNPVISAPAIAGAAAAAAATAAGGTNAIDNLNATAQRNRHLQSLPVMLLTTPGSDAGLASGAGSGSGSGGGGTSQPSQLQQMSQAHVVLPPGPGAPNMATTAVMIDGGGLLSRGSVHMPTARGPSAGSSTPQQHLEELCLLGLVSSGSGDTDSPAAVITGMGGGGSGLRHSASLPFAAPRTMLRPHRGYPSVGGAGGRGGTVAAAAASTGPEGPAVLRPRASVSAGHMMVMGIETAHIGGTQEGEGGQQRSSSVSQQARLGSGAVDARSHGRSVSTEPVTTGQPSAKRIRTADGHFAVTAVNAVDGGCGEAAVAAAAVNGVAAVAQVPPGTSNIRAARIMEAALWRSGGGAGPDATQEHAESFLGLQHQLLVPGCVAGAIGDAAAAAALGAVSRQLGIRVVDVDTRLMPAVLGLVRAAGLLGGRPPPILLQAANCRDTLLPPPPPPGTLRTLFQTADGRILPGHVMPVNALVDGDVEIEDVTTGQELNPRTRGSLGADASGVNVDWMREYEDAWDEVLDAAARRRGSAPAPAQPQRLPTKSESDGSGPAVAVTAVAGTVLASGGTHATGPAESEHLMLDGDAAGEPMRPEASFRQPKHQQQQQQQHPWLQQLQLQIHSATGRQLPCQELAVPSHIGRGTEGTAAAAGEQPPDALALMASVRQQSPRELEVKPHGGRGQLYQSPQEQQQRAPEHQQQHGYRPNMQKCSDIDALREEIQQHLEEGLTKQELRRQLQRRQGLIQHQQQHHHHHHLSQKVTVPSAGVKEQNIEPKKESLGPVICSTDSLEAGRGGDVSRQWDATAGPCVTSERYTSAGREVVGVEPMLGAVAPLGAGGATRGPVGRHRVNPDEDYSMQISDDDSGRRLGGDGDGGSRGIAASGGDGSHGRGLILCSQDSRGRRSQPPLPRPPVQPFRQARRISDDTNRAGNDTAVATAAATDAATHGDVANAISGHEDECTTAGRRRDVPTLLLSLPRADSGDRYAQQPAAAAAGGWDKGRQPSAGWAFSEHQLQPLQQSRAEMATGHSNVALPGNTAAPTHEADNKPRWTSRREQQRQQQQERQQQQQQDAMASVLSAVIPAATLPRAQVLLGRDGSLVIVDPSDGVVLAETPAAAAAEALSDLAPALRVHEHLRQYGRQQPSQQRSRATEMRTESSDGNQFRSMDRAAASGGGGRSSGSGGGGYGSHGNISRPLRSPPRGGGARTSGTLLGDAAPPSPPPPAAGLADASSTGNLEPILVQNHQHLNRRRLVYENSRGLHVMESSFGGSGAARGGGDCAARDSDPYHAFAQRPPLPPRSQAELHFGCVGTETQQQASAVRPSLSLQLTPLSSHQSVLLQQQGRQMREAQQHHQHLRLGRVHLQQPAGVESDGGHGQPMPRPRTAEGEVEAAALALSQLGAVAGRPRSAPSGVISGPVQETVDDDVVEVSG